MTVQDLTEENGGVKSFEIISEPFGHKTKLEISISSQYVSNVWIGTNDTGVGSRLDLEGIDELVTVLLYAKKLIEDNNEY
jgi:hypothetical protein